MNLFAQVKQAVSAKEAAIHYGVKVNRSNMACCPFHPDKHPSMKITERFYCFGCGKQGDVIDLTAELFHLGKCQAAQKLATDFSIAVTEDKHLARHKHSSSIKKELSTEDRFRKQEKRCCRVLLDYFNLLKQWEIEYAPKQREDEWHPLFVRALQEMCETEHLLDVMLQGDVANKAHLVIDHGRRLIQLEDEIGRYDHGGYDCIGKYAICHGRTPND